jgi:hypothetical protein
LNDAIIRQAILDRRSLGATYDGAALSFSPHWAATSVARAACSLSSMAWPPGGAACGSAA